MEKTTKTNKTLTTVELLIGIAVGLLTPVATGVASYYKSLEEIHSEVNVVKVDYVKKDDFGKLDEKINKISEDVAEIKGYLRKGR